MNRYGIKARKHWQDWLPDQYQELENPEEFFTLLGETAAQEIDQLADSLASQSPPQDSHQGETARLATARRLAENQITRDLLLVDPDDQEKIAQLMS